MMSSSAPDSGTEARAHEQGSPPCTARSLHHRQDSPLPEEYLPGVPIQASQAEFLPRHPAGKRRSPRTRVLMVAPTSALPFRRLPSHARSGYGLLDLFDRHSTNLMPSSPRSRSRCGGWVRRLPGWGPGSGSGLWWSRSGSGCSTGRGHRTSLNRPSRPRSSRTPHRYAQQRRNTRKGGAC
jgi:hypothetical protein